MKRTLRKIIAGTVLGGALMIGCDRGEVSYEPVGVESVVDYDEGKISFEEYFDNQDKFPNVAREFYKENGITEAYFNTEKAYEKLSKENKRIVNRVCLGNLTKEEIKKYEQFEEEAEWSVLNKDGSIPKSSAIAMMKLQNYISELWEFLDALKGSRVF